MWGWVRVWVWKYEDNRKHEDNQKTRRYKDEKTTKDKKERRRHEEEEEKKKRRRGQGKDEKQKTLIVWPGRRAGSVIKLKKRKCSLDSSARTYRNAYVEPTVPVDNSYHELALPQPISASTTPLPPWKVDRFLLEEMKHRNMFKFFNIHLHNTPHNYKLLVTTMKIYKNIIQIYKLTLFIFLFYLK